MNTFNLTNIFILKNPAMKKNVYFNIQLLINFQLLK